jgi:hypothetical protein
MGVLHHILSIRCVARQPAAKIMRRIEMRQSEHFEASAPVVVRQGFCPDCGLPRPIPGGSSPYSDRFRE